MPMSTVSLPRQSGENPDTRGALAGALLAIISILYLRRYIGINHDAALYLGEALLGNWPEIFRHDLFFVHGSQGSYTVLPWLVSRMFEWMPPSTVFLTGALLGLFAFAGAAWYFICAVLPKQQCYWALLGILSLPTAYGMGSIFSYAEPFLTSRPLAEAACLLGLGLFARQRLYLAALSILIAGLLHPLQALAACLVAWPWLVLQDRRWLYALGLLLPLALLGWIGPPPFSDLFRVFDQEWLTVVQHVTGQLFLTMWNMRDFSVLMFDALLLVYAWQALPKALSDWCLAALAGLVLGFCSTLILADGLHLVLPTALQTWRVHWLAHLLAMATLAAFLYRDVHAKELARALCLGLTLLLVHSSTWVWIPFALLYGAWMRIFGNEPTTIKRLLGILCMIAMLVLFALYAANEWLLFRMAHYRLELYAIDRRLLTFPLLALGLPLLGVWLWQRNKPWLRWSLLLGVLVPLLVVGAWRWDARPPMARMVEDNRIGSDLFGPVLPDQAQVFWVGDQYPSVWLALRRAEFFSVRQLAGVVFNRGTAMEAWQRIDRIRLIVGQDMYCKQLPEAQRDTCRPDDEALRIVCRSGPTRHPDYLVLPYQQSQRALGHWDFIDPATSQPAVTYWLYSCSQVMEDLGGDVPVQSR